VKEFNVLVIVTVFLTSVMIYTHLLYVQTHLWMANHVLMILIVKVDSVTTITNVLKIHILLQLLFAITQFLDTSVMEILALLILIAIISFAMKELVKIIMNIIALITFKDFIVWDITVQMIINANRAFVI
jgi:hypothetical protein